MIHLKFLEKQEQAEPNASRRRDIKKRPEINEIGTKNVQRIKETISLFLEKVIKSDKPLVNLTKMKRVKSQTNNIRRKKKGRR
jgi:hypothetical protein